MTDNQVCFVISPIGEENSDIRKQADLVLKHIVSAPVESAGYKVIRADQIEKSGVITNQVIEHVLESELVIADLSGHNPNVFYELALRHAAQKPLIQMIRKGEDLPFDVAPMRTIRYELDLEGADKATRELTGFIGQLSEDDHVASPVSMAIDLYKQSGKSSHEQQLISLRNEVGQVLSELQNIYPKTGSVRGDGVNNIIRKLEELHNNESSISYTIVSTYADKNDERPEGYPLY